MNRYQQILQNTPKPVIQSASHKIALRKALLLSKQFDEKYNFLQHILMTIQKKSIAVSTLTVSIALIAILAANVLTPVANLTTDKVLAEAVENYEKTAKEQGRFHFSKQKMVTEAPFLKDSETYFTETWEDTETGNSRAKVTNENGEIIDEYAIIEDDYYMSENINYFGGAFISGTVSVDGSESDIKIISGDLSEASGSANVSSVGDLVIDFKEVTDNEVGVFSISSEEISEAGSVISINSDNGEVVTTAMPQNDTYSKIWNLTMSPEKTSRVEMFKELKNNEEVNYIDAHEWEGYRVYGLQIQNEFGDSSFETTFYFSTEDYSFVGSEDISTWDDQSFTNKVVILEDSYTDVNPNINAEGLVNTIDMIMSLPANELKSE